MRKKRIKFIKQLDSNDCGLACLAMVFNYFGKEVSLSYLKANTRITSDGISIANLMAQANDFQIDLFPLSISTSKLLDGIALPAIFFWEQEHFFIVERITSKHVYIVDPSCGRVKMNWAEFEAGWLIDDHTGVLKQHPAKEGVLLLINPSDKFHDQEFEPSIGKPELKWKFIKDHFLRYKEENVRVTLSLIAISVLQLLIPFSNQLIVDYGIQNGNISFIYAIAFCLSLFYIFSALNEFIRSWSLTYLSARINYQLISSFLMKITALPIKTINSKKIGDYIERINDHKKLENYFSESVIRSLFAIFTLIVYSSILLVFSYKVFLILLLLSTIELIWIFRFLNSMKSIENKLFSLNAVDQDKILEILYNLPDIKLNSIEDDKNKEWQSIQLKLFKNYQKKLKLNQIEQGGSKILAALQLFAITIFSAICVINKELTIGQMFSIIFIVSQLNFPISQLINFVINTQLIGNSFQRIYEIHHLKVEDEGGNIPESIKHVDIEMKNVSFSYNSDRSILNNVSITIPHNKTTAIVGYSGSGKTTLLKLLLKFYDDYNGTIFVGYPPIKLKQLKSSYWRSKCGAVLQESSIYSDSIAYNVSLKRNDDIDIGRLNEALQLACMDGFINELPLGVNTKLNADGSTLSSGQKQRLLIARLIYKNPPYVFLDEATNSLDASTERVIVDNLKYFFKNKTIVIVAHRLSTVINADQILVINKGEIVERGNHSSLILKNGAYLNLIRNQLELADDRKF